MSSAVIWDQLGNILHSCSSLEEAEGIIKECQYTEIDRIRSDGCTNIVVMDF